jgi:hypothetical protein
LLDGQAAFPENASVSGFVGFSGAAGWIRTGSGNQPVFWMAFSARAGVGA